MEASTSKNCQKSNNHFSISRAKKRKVTICLILKEFLVREVVVFRELGRTVARTTPPILKEYVLPAAKSLKEL